MMNVFVLHFMRNIYIISRGSPNMGLFLWIGPRLTYYKHTLPPRRLPCRMRSLLVKRYERIRTEICRKKTGLFVSRLSRSVKVIGTDTDRVYLWLPINVRSKHGQTLVPFPRYSKIL